MKLWPFAGVAFVATVLALAHWFLFHSWLAFWPDLALGLVSGLRLTLSLLAFSFIVASLLSFRFHNLPVRIFYAISAVWLGFLNFFFWSALLGWLASDVLLLTHAPNALVLRGQIAAALTLLAVLVSLWGFVNARILHVRRHTVPLKNLPDAWQGRTALVLSDVHLGHINGRRFLGRVARLAEKLAPNMILLPGDLFDGGAADTDHVLAPFSALHPPQGFYFSSGNHDEFGDMAEFTRAIRAAGIQVLSNEAVDVDGLRILGVSFHDASSPLHLQATLERLLPAEEDRPPSVLLSHVPNRLPILLQAGVDLVVCGHTHSGQIFPFTWLTRRIFGAYTHGLHPFAALQVCTSSGVGVWGPPMRVGSSSEVVLLRFEKAS